MSKENTRLHASVAKGYTIALRRQGACAEQAFGNTVNCELPCGQDKEDARLLKAAATAEGLRDAQGLARPKGRAAAKAEPEAARTTVWTGTTADSPQKQSTTQQHNCRSSIYAVRKQEAGKFYPKKEPAQGRLRYSDIRSVFMLCPVLEHV